MLEFMSDAGFWGVGEPCVDVQQKIEILEDGGDLRILVFFERS